MNNFCGLTTFFPHQLNIRQPKGRKHRRHVLKMKGRFHCLCFTMTQPFCNLGAGGGGGAYTFNKSTDFFVKTLKGKLNQHHKISLNLCELFNIIFLISLRHHQPIYGIGNIQVASPPFSPNCFLALALEPLLKRIKFLIFKLEFYIKVAYCVNPCNRDAAMGACIWGQVIPTNSPPPARCPHINHA